MTNLELKEYYEIIKPILLNYEFQNRKTYSHHENESVFIHSLKVSKIAYKIAKKFNKDYKAAAIGGLLHDFYLHPWQGEGAIVEKRILKKHGFAHAKCASNNAKCEFSNLIDRKIDNMILRHMFPLNLIPPRYAESWIVNISDKYISLNVLKHPKEFPKYLGFKKGK